jgi:hypothetical protein
MVLGDVEEKKTFMEIDDETYEGITKVTEALFFYAFCFLFLNPIEIDGDSQDSAVVCTRRRHHSGGAADALSCS